MRFYTQLYLSHTYLFKRDLKMITKIGGFVYFVWINKDNYIAALLGLMVQQVTKPPYKWEITYADFQKYAQDVAPAYIKCEKSPWYYVKKKYKLKVEIVFLLFNLLFLTLVDAAFHIDLATCNHSGYVF